eukprot:1518675-Amphidinium_carterae.1
MVWQWLRSTYHTLRSTGMQGWGDFLPRQVQHPATYKSATTTIDQGSDGWTTVRGGVNVGTRRLSKLLKST